MIQVQKTRLALTQGLPTTRVANRGVEVRRPRGRADTGPTIRGHLDDERVPSIVVTAARLLGVKTITGLVTLIVITAAASPADATVSEHVAHRRPGRVHQHAGVVRPQGGTNKGVEALGTGGETLGGDEAVWIV